MLQCVAFQLDRNSMTLWCMRCWHHESLDNTVVMSLLNSTPCLSCCRVIATRDWSEFEVVGEVCGTIFALPPTSTDKQTRRLPCGVGEMDLRVTVPARSSTRAVPERSLRLSTADDRTSNELAFIRPAKYAFNVVSNETARLVSPPCLPAAESGDAEECSTRDMRGCASPVPDWPANVALVETQLRGLPAVLVVTLSKIQAGEELLVRHSEAHCGTMSEPDGAAGQETAQDEHRSDARDTGFCHAPVRMPASRCQRLQDDGMVAPGAMPVGAHKDCGVADARYCRLERSWPTAPKFALSGQDKTALKTPHVPGASVRCVTEPLHPACGQVVPGTFQMMMCRVGCVVGSAWRRRRPCL